MGFNSGFKGLNVDCAYKAVLQEETQTVTEVSTRNIYWGVEVADL